MDRWNRRQQSVYTPEQTNAIIRNLGINVVNEVPDGWIMFCPFHNNYRTPAGEMDKTGGHFYCFGCGTSINLTTFVMNISQKTYFEAIRFIESFKTSEDIISGIDRILEDKPEYEPFDELLIKRLNNQALDSPRAMRYYEGRRITRESVEKFSLGYSEKQDMITIPVQSPDGSIYVGFVGRSVEGKDFKNTPGLPKSKVLFNLHRAKRFSTVYVVESSFDAIRLDQCGVPAMATLGAMVTKTQMELLTKHFNNVIVIPDNDAAGQEMAGRIIERLGSRAASIGIPERFKDIGDMTDADISELTKRINDPLLAMY